MTLKSKLLSEANKVAPPANDPFDPLLSPKDLPKLGVSYHANHLRRLWMRGDFPAPRHISARKIVWRRSTILEWIEKQLAADGIVADTTKKSPAPGPVSKRARAGAEA